MPRNAISQECSWLHILDDQDRARRLAMREFEREQERAASRRRLETGALAFFMLAVCVAIAAAFIF